MTSAEILTPNLPRLVVFGASGFIGGAVAREAEACGLPVLRLGRSDRVEDVLTDGDVLINAALRPAYRRQPYAPEADLDRELAAVAAARGAHMVMLSSRRVYGPDHRWGAKETDPAPGDETQYGRNKARTEAWLSGQDAPPACVLRLSNVFGFEYAPGARRDSFFGAMLADLKESDAVIFHMATATRRDFIPVEAAARAIVAAARQRLTGVFNVGSGFAVPCGALAEALCEGYGRGTIRAGADVRDEFYLDVSKWTDRFPLSVSEDDLINYCRRLGERLSHA